jgi:hypothetical protein
MTNSDVVQVNERKDGVQLACEVQQGLEPLYSHTYIHELRKDISRPGTPDWA